MNTLFMLLAEFETGDIPLSQVSEKYFGLSVRKAAEKALSQTLPVPVYRCGSQKSQWLVSAKDLAEYVDERRNQGASDWSKMKAATGAA